MIGRDERRAHRRERVVASMPAGDVEATLDLLALTDFAWHDCYGSATPEDVVDLILVVGRDRLADLVAAAHLAVLDRRDLQVAADEIRRRRPGPPTGA